MGAFQNLPDELYSIFGSENIALSRFSFSLLCFQITPEISKIKKRTEYGFSYAFYVLL